MGGRGGGEVVGKGREHYTAIHMHGYDMRKSITLYIKKQEKFIIELI